MFTAILDVNYEPPSLWISFGTPKVDTHCRSEWMYSLEIVFFPGCHSISLEKLFTITIIKEFPFSSSFSGLNVSTDNDVNRDDALLPPPTPEAVGI